VTGYALSFGDSWRHTLGSTKFLLLDATPADLVTFTFHLPFAATATTIVSGSMAERTRLNSYLVQVRLFAATGVC
jgi:Amt family ammonium transporter